MNVIPEKIILETKDGVKIAGDYCPGTLEKGVVLLHMMPATRKSWNVFVPQLVERGYHILTVDLRGHGESDGGPDGYKNFSDVEHRRSIYDVEAAVEFLKEKEIPAHAIALVGASIGANLSLWYAVNHPHVRNVVLLSPGFNYRGIETKPLVKRLHAGQHVLFVSSHDDHGKMGNNAEMNKELSELVPRGVIKKLILYYHAGHGTDMFGLPAQAGKEPPDLAQEILHWISS